MKNPLKNHRIVRIMLWTIIVIAALIGFALIFMRAYPVFGGRPTKADREDYAKRAEGYFDGKKFYYPSEWEIEGVNADNRVSDKGTTPKDSLPVETPDFTKAAGGDVTITWLGHSSLLIQMSGKNILVDPVFSKRSSPFQWIGPARFT